MLCQIIFILLSFLFLKCRADIQIKSHFYTPLIQNKEFISMKSWLGLHPPKRQKTTLTYSTSALPILPIVILMHSFSVALVQINKTSIVWYCYWFPRVCNFCFHEQNLTRSSHNPKNNMKRSSKGLWCLYYSLKNHWNCLNRWDLSQYYSYYLSSRHQHIVACILWFLTSDLKI